MDRVETNLRAEVARLQAENAVLVAKHKDTLCDISGKPYQRTLRCDPSSDESVREVATAICSDYLDGTPLTSTKISGGITNQLRRASQKDGRAVLLRCYGAEGMIDRDIETATFAALGDWLGRPAYIGRFANGRVEEWLDGYHALSLDEMASPKLAPLIARGLARLHQFTLPPHLEPHYPKAGSLWETIAEWHAQASSADTAPTIAGRSASDAKLLEEKCFDMAFLEESLKTLRSRVPKGCKLVFSHNDLLCGNIMLHEETGQFSCQISYQIFCNSTPPCLLSLH
jgi:thiamine kinase-like enzyme